MTDSIDVYAVPTAAHQAGFQRGEIVTAACGRCKKPQVPWQLRPFGTSAICPTCYETTLELARGAIRAMPINEVGRACSQCRALRKPELGSAWCPITELGDHRARICANFVPEAVESARADIHGGRSGVIELWARVRRELAASVGDNNVETWFGQVEPLSVEGDRLVLGAPDQYTRDWLEQRFDAVVRMALLAAGYPELRPAYIVEKSAQPEISVPVLEKKADKAGMNPHYTFSEFVVGGNNRLAHASALAAVDKPGEAYNPLVLYGGVGVGKTHLLQAIGHEVIDRSDKVVLYKTSEAFTNELIAAIRDGATGAFRERYRQVDYLLLDDIQFIAGKEATQEEFFHTFNALHQAGKQIVVTSDRPPSELRTLEDRLRSRFAWGLTVDMQPPDLETRAAILRSKAEMAHRRLPETVLDALAHRVRGNVRELEGALNRVVAVADMMGTEPGMDVVRQVLGDPEGPDGTCHPADVLQAVAAYYRVKPSDLAGQQRERTITYARQMAMYLLREEVKLSLVEVGNHVGGRNHSTVIYGCERIAKEVSRKGRVKQDVQAIKQLIYGVR